MYNTSNLDLEVGKVYICKIGKKHESVIFKNQDDEVCSLSHENEIQSFNISGPCKITKDHSFKSVRIGKKDLEKPVLLIFDCRYSRSQFLKLKYEPFIYKM